MLGNIIYNHNTTITSKMETFSSVVVVVVVFVYVFNFLHWSQWLPHVPNEWN